MRRPLAPWRSAEPDTGDTLTAAAFAQATLALAGHEWSAWARVAVAVSGGGDSLALMALAADAFPGRVHVLSFDHRLRPESVDECALVARLATDMDLPHTILFPEMPLAGANLQANARAARYAAMSHWCAAHASPFLLTAHHADDQAETLLLRLARGSGLGGLSGIRGRRALGSIIVLRPLLGWRKADLLAVVQARGWQPVDDPSNSSPRFDRTRARALLAETGWLDVMRMASAAAHLADAEAALGWAAEQAWASRSVAIDAGIVVDPEGLPPELRRRLLVQGLAHHGIEEPDGAALARAAMRLAAGGTATLGSVKMRALKSGRWQLTLAPVRKIAVRKNSRPA